MQSGYTPTSETYPTSMPYLCLYAISCIHAIPCIYATFRIHALPCIYATPVLLCHTSAPCSTHFCVVFCIYIILPHLCYTSAPMPYPSLCHSLYVCHIFASMPYSVSVAYLPSITYPACKPCLSTILHPCIYATPLCMCHALHLCHIQNKTV